MTLPPAGHERDCGPSLVRCGGVAAAVLLTVLMAGPAIAQVSLNASAHAQRYLECPAAGVSIQFFTDPQATPPQDNRSPTFPPLVGPVEFWPGDAGWTQPEPVPDEVLSDPGSWIRPPSMIDHHEALRLRNGRPLPVGSPRILIFQYSNHWGSIESSTVAVRGTDGVWRLDRVGEINAGRDSVTPWVKSGWLSNDAGSRLDSLLSDQCLDAEPADTELSQLWSSTNPHWVIQIEGVGSPVRVAGANDGFGRVGAVRYLLFGALQEDEQ